MLSDFELYPRWVPLFIEGLIFVMLKEKKEKWYTKEKSWISDTLTGTVARTV